MPGQQLCWPRWAGPPGSHPGQAADLVIEMDAPNGRLGASFAARS